METKRERLVRLRGEVDICLNKLDKFESITDYKVPLELKNEDFSAARVEELKRLLETQKIKNIGKCLHQKLPNHLRRRSMSFNPHLLPRRERKKILKMRDQDEKHPLKKNKKLKARRKKRNIDEIAKKKSLFNDKNLDFNPKWMINHVWHAKRMFMADIWDCKIALKPTTKSNSFLQKASINHSVLFDESFRRCIRIKVPENNFENFVNIFLRTLANKQIQNEIKDFFFVDKLKISDDDKNVDYKNFSVRKQKGMNMYLSYQSSTNDLPLEIVSINHFERKYLILMPHLSQINLNKLITCISIYAKVSIKSSCRYKLTGNKSLEVLLNALGKNTTESNPQKDILNFFSNQNKILNNNVNVKNEGNLLNLADLYSSIAVHKSSNLFFTVTINENSFQKELPKKNEEEKKVEIETVKNNKKMKVTIILRKPNDSSLHKQNNNKRVSLTILSSTKTASSLWLNLIESGARVSGLLFNFELGLIQNERVYPIDFSSHERNSFLRSLEGKSTEAKVYDYMCGFSKFDSFVRKFLKKPEFEGRETISVRIKMAKGNPAPLSKVYEITKEIEEILKKNFVHFPKGINEKDNKMVGYTYRKTVSLWHGCVLFAGCLFKNQILSYNGVLEMSNLMVYDEKSKNGYKCQWEIFRD